MKNIITLIIISLSLTLSFGVNAQSTIIIGNGTSVNSYSDYPTPYGNYYWGSKEQYLVRASEMISAGATAGNISDISFNVSGVNGVALQGFAIKMGTTTDTTMGNYFYNGLMPVYTTGSYIEFYGWNTHNFQNQFYFDGVSNLIIEVCFNNTNWTNNAGVYSTSTSYPSSLSYNDDAMGICSQTNGQTYSQRPNMKFTIVPPPSNDLGILSINNPVPYVSNTPNSSQIINISVVNRGTTAQDSFNLGYSVDGGANFVTEAYNGTINAGDTLSYSFTTTANMGTMGYYSMIAFVNNAGDALTSNDTLQAGIPMCNPFSGTYSVGTGSSYDFNSLNDVAGALSTCGISGPVNILVANGIYTEQVYFGNIPGSSSINTITVSSASGDPNDVFIQYDSYDYNNNYVLRLDNAHYFKIKNLSFKALNGYNNTAIRIENGSENCIIYNNSIYSINGGNGALIYLINSNNNIIRKNYLNGGYSGIDVNGIDSYTSTNNITIDSNDISGFSYNGINASFIREMVVNRNMIYGTTDYNNLRGISTNKCFDETKVINNTIKIETTNANSCYGIRSYYDNYQASSDSSVHTSLYANNMISIQSGGSGGYGLYSYYSENINYYSNSVSINGNANASYTLYSASNSNFAYPPNYVNNIFANYCGGYAAYYSNQSGTVDYNNYYTENGTTFVYWGGLRANLAALQTVSNRDIHSVSINPQFASASDLHSTSIAMADKGTTLSSVLYDIDGQLRSTQTPDIGADEYTPPQNNITAIGVYSPSSPADDDCDLGNESMVIRVVNNGIGTQTSIPFGFKLDNYNAISETWTGSLATGDTLEYLFTNLANFTQAGSHNMQIYVGLSNDENKLDDTITFKSFKTYQSISSFPFYDDFENRTNLYYHTNYNNESHAAIDTMHGFSSESAIRMDGGEYYSDWNYTGSSIESHLQNNMQHFASVSMCPFDATNLTNLRMSFKIEQNKSGTNNSFFFVKINDSLYAKTLNGDSVWTEIQNNNSVQTLTFDLAPFVGGSIKISLCAILRTNQDYYSGQVDDVTIDDLRIYVPQNNDVGIADIIGTSQSRCGSPTDSIYIKIKNYGILPQTNIPVHVNVIWGTTSQIWNVTYNDTLQPESEGWLYLGTLNTSINGNLILTSYTSLSSDQDHSNDSLNMMGYQEIYKEIPHIEDFEDNGNNWNMSDFYIQEMYYFGMPGNALAIDAYGSNENIMPKNIGETYYSYAKYDELIGVIGPNSYLIYDYYFINKSYFNDSIVINISTDCDNDNFQIISAITANNNINTNTWYKVAVPLTNFVGEKAKIGIYKESGPLSQSNYLMVIDNIGIVNATPIDLGQDTSICYNENYTLNTGLSAANGFKFSWQGPGVTAADTLPTLNVTASGTYSVSVLDSNGMTTSDAVNIIVRPQVSGSLTLTYPTICVGNNTSIGVNVTGDLPILFEWNDGTTSIIDTTYSYYVTRNFSPSTTTSYTLTNITDINGCSASINDQVIINVNQLPVVSASGLDTQYCASDATVSLTGIPAGGNFSGAGISGNNFDPNIASPGQHNVYYEYTDTNGCTDYDTLSTIVYANPTVGIVSVMKSMYCSNEPIEMIYAFPNGGTFTGGGMTGNIFNPANANVGLNTVSYSYTDIHNCTSLDSINFTVNATPTVSISTTLNSSYCIDESPISLTANPSGGVFTGNGVNGTSFDPSLAGVGTAIIIYTYTNGSGCTSSDTISTIINPLPTAVFTTQLASSYCKNGSSINLSGYPSGGVFSGNGVNGNKFYTDSVIDGTHYLYYTTTNINGCINSDSVQVTVNPVPVVSITTSLNSSYCIDEISTNLVATPSGGTFTGDGISGNNFSPSLAGTGTANIYYSYTNAFGCSSSDTISTIVNPIPTVVFTNQFAASYCKNGSSVNLTGYPAGGVFTGNGVNGNKFYTDTATAGNHDLVYAYTDGNGCINSDTAQVTVYALPNVSLAGFTDVCKDVNQVVLSGGSPTGGVYSGNSVNSNLGIFYPTVANIGINSLNYTYTDANGCIATANDSIRVIGIPSASFNLPSVACIRDTIAVSYSGNASAAASFNWNFSNAQGINGSGVGPYTLHYDTAGIKFLSLAVTDSGCVSTIQYNYTSVLDAIANISTVSGSTACYSDSVLLFANSGPGYSYQWYDTSGALTSAMDTLSYFYAVGSGRYYAEVTNNQGCNAMSNEIDAVVYPEILSDFIIPTTACKDDIININFNGINDTTAVYTWSFNGGSIASGSASGPYGIIWNADGTKNVSLIVHKNGCASNMTSKQINIITTPATISPLGATTFCDGGNVTLYPNSGTNLSYEWFKDNITLNDFNPFYTANQTGIYTVKVTNTQIGCVNTSAPVQITVNSTDFNLAFTANQTNFIIPPFDVIITNQTADTANYYWNWSMGDGSSNTVANPSHHYSYDGTYTIGVIAQNINTGCFDTLVKNNYITCSGGSTNPCNLVATITPAGPKTICPGDSILLTAANNAGATYQWLKDGVIISGADTTIYYAKQTGNYQIMVSDAICNKFSTPFSLSIYNTITPAISATGTIMPCSSDSMELSVTSTFNSYLWSNGDTTPNIYITNSGNYTVVGTDINGCKTASSPYVVNASLLQTPEICIVGVDSATNNNFIVWERQANPLIDSFRIYRESNVAGVYNHIGSTSVNDPGFMIDPASNPKVQAYRYKITAVDTCGMETPPSNYHKTIHLTINEGQNGAWNLIWSHYVGFNFGSYRIYRGYDSTALQPLTQIQSTLNSYTDLNPPTGNIYYQIEVVSPHPCYPDSIYSKANTNYNTSRSNNMNTSNAIPNPDGLTEMMITDFSVNVYPNPNSGVFEFELISINNDVYQISMRNVLGQEIYKSNEINVLGRRTQIIDMGKPAPGVYFLIVENQNQRLVKKIIIN